ncbi:hypothetical protein SISSUDRAFT_1038057 [Sistotremastrum suecicum HHB10207 ss-3]|uniref:Uncharacterized protein n=1 Tax=Sistotremastrum suecicum HHB10207 ss-3 TaxID=1314776 RepID=A0A165X9S9_9AGAM|nr:hypothetical protein SISSUDRAFT_1038057 [Sistotremastrum suecicum HHB10207 ss-3]
MAANGVFDHALQDTLHNYRIEWTEDCVTEMEARGFPGWPWFPIGEPQHISLRKMRQFALRYNRVSRYNKIPVASAVRWYSIWRMSDAFFDTFNEFIAAADGEGVFF